MEWFYQERYAPNYGVYYLYQVSEKIEGDGKPKISEVITLD
jgi:hypothetical protein